MNTTRQEPSVQSYTEAIEYLAAAARVGVDFGMAPEAACDIAARNAVQTATDARTRAGIWASSTSTEQIETAQFMGVVASDVLDGTVTRPSVGNVRQALLTAVTR